VYEGEFKDNKKDGKGTWKLADGSVYEGVYKGEFKGGAIDGKGTWKLADGSVYEGEFKGGKKRWQRHMECQESSFGTQAWCGRAPCTSGRWQFVGDKSFRGKGFAYFKYSL
jgi:hypothetical protein